MWIHTLRGRLTLWNAGILTLTLVAFGLVLNYTNQNRLSQEIDTDLVARARQAIHPPPPRPRDGEFQRGQPGDFNGGPLGESGPGGENGEPEMPLNQTGDSVDRLAGPPEPPGPRDDPLFYLHRPELIDPGGTVVAPRSHPPIFDPNGYKAALAGRQVIEDATKGTVPIRVASIPIGRSGRIIGVVQTARDLTDFKSLWKGQTATLLFLVPLALLAGGIGALFLANKALRPVGEATATAARISGQDLSARLPVRGSDELAQLSSTFNGMLKRIQESFERQQKAYEDLEKSYDSQRRFTGDASHELRTPLTRLKLATSSALNQQGVPQTVIDSLRIADQSADSMSKIVQQLLLLSKADAGQLGLDFRPVDLRVPVAEAADALRERKIEVCLPEEPITVSADEDHIKRVFLNLLQNAVRHTPEGKRIRIGVAAQDGWVVASVADEGEGIAAEHLAHLGERFYRVDTARSREEGGFGLGLSICKSIVEAHGGRMEFRSRIGAGTEVRVLMPAAQPSQIH